MTLSIVAGNFRPVVASSSTAPPTTSLSTDPRQVLNDRLSALATRQVVARATEFREELSVLQSAINDVRIDPRPRSARAISADSLGLNSAITTASFTSSEEISTESTAFSPTTPEWQQGSQVSPTVGGRYNGDQGSGNLTFTAISGGIRGIVELRIQVTGPVGEFVDEVVVGTADPVDTQYALSNGLTLELGSGTLLPGDSFVVAVEDGLDLAIDPAVAFDGSDGSLPGFDNGESIVAGSFFVNGVEINVAESDSVNSILAAIDASAANVSATYDEASETVQLTQKTPGSAATISLSADSSGLLSALKLDDGILSAGTDSEIDSPIQQVPAFAGVTAGSFLINDNAIAVDPANDSLTAIVERINASTANVTAELTSSQRLSIRNVSKEDSLELDDNGTGFFQSVGIVAAVYESRSGKNAPAQTDIDEIVSALKAVFVSYNNLFADSDLNSLAGTTGIKQEAEQAITQALEAAGITDRELGFDLTSGIRSSSLDFVDNPAHVFRRQLRRNFAEVRAIFIDPAAPSSVGLLQRLAASVNRFLGESGESGSVGTLLDTTA